MRSPILTIAWGLFCATSWTWCIGMYLPRILIDRFGWSGFLAFAVPNVVGCVAFGYVLKTRARSDALCQQHGPVMRLFSSATIAFHVFFLLALSALGVLPFGPDGLMTTLFTGGSIVLAIGVSVLPRRFVLLPGVVGYVASLVVFAEIGLSMPDFGWSGRVGTEELVWVTPVLVFGFLLCPYFDLTFHRALQESESGHVFAVFGAGFAIMLLLTCLIWQQPALGWSLALGHLYWQSIVSMGLHLGAWRCSANPRQRWELWCPMLLVVCAVGAAFVGVFVTETPEDFYLRFLVFYGLLFPAYAIVFMAPGVRVALSRRNVMVFAVAVLAATPFYELGFIHGKFWTLGIPMSAVIAWVVSGVIRPRTTPAS